MLYLLLAIALAAGVAVYLMKKGKIKDEDGDFIPDVLEDKVEDIKEDVQDVVKKVKNKVEDIKEDVEDFVEEVKDLPAKISRKKPGPKRAPRKNSTPAQRGTKSGGGSGNTSESGHRNHGTGSAVLKKDQK